MKVFWLVLGLICFNESMAFSLPKSFSAKFEQEYISVLKGNTKTSQGTIDYMYPGNIRFETISQNKIIFVSNGVKSWYYRAPFIEGEDGEVSESSSKEGASVYIKFFDSLKNGLISNHYYDVKPGSGGGKLLVFKSQAVKELGIKEAVLVFNLEKSKEFSSLKKIDLLFPDGKKSTLKFIDLKINPIFGLDKFNFIAPPHTKKVN